MNWAIAFLARTYASTYNEVAKIMMLPNIFTVYRKTAELITTKNDKACCMHMNTVCSISDRAHRENWMSNQRIGNWGNCSRDLVLHQVIVVGSHHGNSDLLCVKGPVCQPTNNEHRHSGVVFWRCLTDGGRQHQQVNGSRVRPSGQEGEHFQRRQILSSWQ